MYLIGIDVGTGACKTLLFDLEGKALASASMEYPVRHPKPTWAEQDPEGWWRAVVHTLREVIKTSGVDPKDIAGISVDSQREAVIPIDKEGRVLYQAIIWLDKRASPQVKVIHNRIPNEDVLRITGVKIDQIFSAAKILWIKENMPKVFERTECFLCVKDFIIFRLTGEKVTDYSMASRTMLFDIHRKKWSSRICEVLDIPIEKLPPAFESSAVVGEITSEAAKLTGLKGGTPVVNGGGDRPCEALGAGVIDPGVVNAGTGTATVLTTPLTSPKVDPTGRVDCNFHVIPNTWEYEALINTTGASLRWFRDTFALREKELAERSGVNVYDILVKEAEKVDVGSDGLFFYPYLSGALLPFPDDRAKGSFYGITLAHTKAHFIRAILEGVAFQYLGTMDILGELGVTVAYLHLVGGEAKSDLWNQIKADVTGREIRVPLVKDAAPLGAALLAGIGTGQYRDAKDAVEKAVKIEKVFKPDEKRHAKYLKVYKKYVNVYRVIMHTYDLVT